MKRTADYPLPEPAVKKVFTPKIELSRDNWTAIASFLPCKELNRIRTLNKWFQQLFSPIMEKRKKEMILDDDPDLEAMKIVSDIRNQIYRSCYGTKSFPHKKVPFDAIWPISSKYGWQMQDGKIIIRSNSDINPDTLSFDLESKEVANYDGKFTLEFYKFSGDKFVFVREIKLEFLRKIEVEKCKISQFYNLDIISFKIEQNHKFTTIVYDPQNGKLKGKKTWRFGKIFTGNSSDGNSVYHYSELGPTFKQLLKFDLQKELGPNDEARMRTIFDGKEIKSKIFFVAPNIVKITFLHENHSVFVNSVTKELCEELDEEKMANYDGRIFDNSIDTSTLNVEISAVQFADSMFFAIIFKSKERSGEKEWKSLICSRQKGLLFSIDAHVIDSVCYNDITYLQTQDLFVIIPCSLHHL